MKKIKLAVYWVIFRWQMWRYKRLLLRTARSKMLLKYLKWRFAFEKALRAGAPLEAVLKHVKDSLYIFDDPKEVNVSNEIVLGSKVVIKECHSMPQIVGKTGVVKALLFVDESNSYPMYVILDEPIMLSQETPPQMGGIVIQIPWRGPHLCRPDELELVGSEPKGNVPDVFNKAFEDKPKDEGNDDKGS